MNDVHKLKIFNRSPGNISTGYNTVIELDGKPLKGAVSIKFEARANSISKVFVELLADVEIDADVESILVRDSEPVDEGSDHDLSKL